MVPEVNLFHQFGDEHTSGQPLVQVEIIPLR